MPDDDDGIDLNLLPGVPEQDEDSPITAAEEAEAKALEMDRLKLIYESVPAEQATGKQFLSTRWVVNRKADGKVRARFVAREFKSMDSDRNDLFAVTSSTITTRLVDVWAAKGQGWTLTGDVSNAFLHAPEPDEVFCSPPAEFEADQGRVWR